MLVKGMLLTDPDAPPEQGWLRVHDGRIAELGLGENHERADLGGAGVIICPAFVDAHLHLPQIESVGADGMGLLEWLAKVIYPAETWWGRGGSPAMLRSALRRMVREGTCAFAGYLTSDAETGWRAVEALAFDPALPRMRAAVGRVAMDREAPEALTGPDLQRAALTPRPSVALHPIERDARATRVEVSLNPRFAISCTDELLAECGWLAQERARQGAPMVVQTHLAESRPECARVAELFPGAPHYTGVYDSFGLLTRRTLLAHCVHMADAEWELIRARGSVVVHCPAANIFLESGLFDLDAARDHAVRLALGSDVAAGSDIAMPRVARGMIETVKVRKMTVAPNARIPTPAEAWRLITRGNAEAIGWEDQGLLAPGARADLLCLRVPPDWLDEHLVGRLLYAWDSGLIQARVIDGRLVEPATI